MSEGMARGAPVAEPKVVEPIVHNNVETIPTYNSIPIELMRFFDVDMATMNDRDTNSLQNIYNLVGAEKPMGEVLQEISRIQRYLGCKFDCDGHHKVYSYLKLTAQADDILKQRDAMRG